jgi:general secretion pathway protein G
MKSFRGFGGYRRARGFTLLEIVVVMVLIALVMSGVVATVNHQRQKAMHSLAQSQVHKLASKIEEYAIDNGSAPDRLEDLLQKPGNARNWNGPYAKPAELKDAYNHDFVYQKPGQHGDYDITSLGADGKDGGEGFDKDLHNWD